MIQKSLHAFIEGSIPRLVFAVLEAASLGGERVADCRRARLCDKIGNARSDGKGMSD
jgi:hypothetical protein